MRIGFIGFGEAGSTVAGGLRSAGVDRLFAFDIKTHDPRFGPLIQRRAVESGTTLVKGLEALMCECVLGATRYDADEYVFRSLNESFPASTGRRSRTIAKSST